MTIRLLDRLGGVAEVRGGAALLGRYVVRDDASGDLLVNSFPARDGMFLVPESGGRWHLLRASERIEGTFARTQMLDPLDVASIRTVGHSLSELAERGGTWLDLLAVSPLVPGMSARAELQPFELRIKENVGHLEEVCRRPRTHLRVEVDRMPVSRARRFPAQAANYLAAHTEDWERPMLRSVVPKRILATVREDQFDIYENRVAVRLVDHLVTHLRRRVQEVSRLLRIFEEAAGNHGSAAGGSHWRQDRIYTLWGKALDASEAKRKAERTLGVLKHLIFTIAGLKDSALYREVPRRATVGTSLTMTNILSDDAHYRRVAELWIEWARLGLEHAVRPREYFDQMQGVCRSFDSFAVLLTLRALEQLRFEPSEIESPLYANGMEVSRGSCVVRVSWSSKDGAISLDGVGVDTLRIVPLCSSLTTLDEEQLRSLLAEADAQTVTGITTLILYPSPSNADAFDLLPADLARRLRSLSHESASAGQRRVGFLPVSPWDIGSVERVARQLRWSTTTPSFFAYPPTITRPVPSEVGRTQPWFDVTGNTMRVLRAPLDNESLHADRLVTESAADLRRLEAEREAVSHRLREVHRAGGATGDSNARKKALNGEVTAAEQRLAALQRFAADLSRSVEAVAALLTCPTCNRRADARRDFKPMGQHFSCTCAGCSTTWGTIACRRCSKLIPVLRLSGADWTARAGASGWVDRTLGADVLAIPWVDGTEVDFACPSCGEGRDDSLPPSAA
ncbi:hypothetical protein HUA78_32460 [Myxococcus sp. CA033]|uniref:hypothetical protein n=1 Tax=Myxococcus sp. CA033 TaxID=2741516 RepID=UPI00157B5848|nr:hypothetical protein [Myxococcus sp. CA033]NTX39158.1 hypothetical protein [Myxococcus sp. CA033]